MKKLPALIVLALCTTIVTAQYKARPLEQLINTTDPGWPAVKGWIDSAKNKVEVLAVDSAKAKDALYKVQVTTRSIMGAIVYNTGGILVDDGWVRILGSGNPRMTRTLPDWNKGKAFKEFGDRPDYFLVADDACGGFFAINYGNFGNDIDSMYYLSPDNLRWEPMHMYYEDFIWFCFNGDLIKFYKGLRWKGWQKDMKALKADEVFHINPPLWSEEGKNIEKSVRAPVPVGEQFLYNLEWRKKLGLGENK